MSQLEQLQSELEETKQKLKKTEETLYGVAEHAKWLNIYRFIAQQMIPVHGLPDDHEDQVNCGRQIKAFNNQHDLLRYGLELAKLPGFVAEFGVYFGNSLKAISQAYGGPVHGFDSFQGLPADWATYKAGELSTDGIIPDDIDNATYHAGWFVDTIPPFLETNNEYAKFVHVDGDLYESAVDVLYGIADRIVPGTVIVFDDYIWSRWLEMEHKAFMEFARDYGLKFSYFGVSFNFLSVGVIIEGKAPNKIEVNQLTFPTAHLDPAAEGHDWTDPTRFNYGILT